MSDIFQLTEEQEVELAIYRMDNPPYGLQPSHLEDWIGMLALKLEDKVTTRPPVQETQGRPGRSFQVFTKKFRILIKIQQRFVRIANVYFDMSPPRSLPNQERSRLLWAILNRLIDGEMITLEWWLSVAGNWAQASENYHITYGEIETLGVTNWNFWGSRSRPPTIPKYHLPNIFTGMGTGRGAGILFRSRQTKRYLILLRSDEVDDSGFWSIPGGESLPDELSWDTAKRETKEEIGLLPQVTRNYSVVTHGEEDDSQYTTYFGSISKEFRPRLNWEHSQHKWVNLEEMETMNLHPGFVEILGTVGQVRW